MSNDNARSGIATTNVEFTCNSNNHQQQQQSQAQVATQQQQQQQQQDHRVVGRNNNKAATRRAADNDTKWMEQLAKVKAYFATHGHFRVPRKTGSDKRLGEWCKC